MEIRRVVPLLLCAVGVLVFVGVFVELTTGGDSGRSGGGPTPPEPEVMDLDERGKPEVGRLVVWNGTTEVLCELYVAPDTQEGGWGESLVAGAPLMPRTRVEFSLAPGTYKARAVSCMNAVLAEEHGLDIRSGQTFHWGLYYDPAEAMPGAEEPGK